MMTTKPVGLYVHIPFCVRKCNYCDFASFGCSDISWRDEYIDALCGEILSYKAKNISVDSIFFGGGTPSLLAPIEFEKIVSAIREAFNVLPSTEFTVEANPKTLDEEKLAAFVKLGVNRLSIGLQSIHDNEMKILGRIHNFDDFLNSYHLARKCGVKNINVDLMYAIPEQTILSFEETLNKVCDLSPEHISLYGLILEEGTPFYKTQKELALPGEDAECDMYYLACEYLKKRGYSHYEISNYAKEGFECRHNLKYWHSEEYIGVGLAAYSYFDGERFGRSRDPLEYIKKNYAQYEYAEEIDKEESKYEYVMLRLRLADGFSLSEYKARFGEDFVNSRKEIIDKHISLGNILLSDDRLRLTERGFYISNTIINELI